MEAHDLETYIAENKREWIDAHSKLAGKTSEGSGLPALCFRKVFENINQAPFTSDPSGSASSILPYWRFALCGSSARKLRRGGANLLAGRALTLAMESFSSAELGGEFDLDFALNWGLLPFVRNEPDAAADILAAYVNTYLKEELQAEGLIRNVPPFVRFLAVAGQINGQVLNVQNIAREAAVARSTVDTYFAVLTDTLVGHLLPAWRPGLKVREAAQPKFYWFDPGVARAAAGLLRDPADRLWQGTALETLIYHELRIYNEVSRKHRRLPITGRRPAWRWTSSSRPHIAGRAALPGGGDRDQTGRALGPVVGKGDALPFGIGGVRGGAHDRHVLRLAQLPLRRPAGLARRGFRKSAACR